VSIIRTHSHTLVGGNDRWHIVLRPLTDEHLPLLCKWNADPEILYYTEGGTDENLSYPPEMVEGIYGSVSQNALCFIIEVNGLLIGECWLQKMNLPEVLSMYAPDTDVRRIDMMIGEKEYWGRGIGTLFVGMMMELAFLTECVDVLHCLCEDYNIRSNRVWEKNGFALALTEDLPQPQIGKQKFHWRMTKEEYRAHIR